MRDKPSLWSRQGPLGRKRIKKIDGLYTKQLRSMFAVEDMIIDISGALDSAGRLDNTYIVFVSDNGLHYGEHRIPEGKGSPFEESIRSPLIVVGPGVPSGASTDAMTSMIDLGPTFADLAGETAPDFVDGRSLVDIFATGNPPADWREAVLSESHAKYGALVTLRSGEFAYIVHRNDVRELYDLSVDPYQLDNIYDNGDPGLISALESRFDALAECGEDGPTTCQAVDGGT